MNTVNNIATATNLGLLELNNRSPVSSLPKEVIELILLSTNDIEKQQASFVNKLWCATSINAAKNEAFSPINTCIELLGQNYNTEKSAILEAVKEIKIENLQQVKTKTDDLREKIINILKNIHLLSLHALSKKVSTSTLKNNLFALAKMHQEIDLVEKHPLADIRISYKADTLIELCQFSKVVDVAFEKFTFQITYKKAVITSLMRKVSSLPVYQQIKTVTQVLENLINDKNDKILKNFIRDQITTLVNISNFAEKSDDFASQYPTFGNMLGDLLNYKEEKDAIIDEGKTTIAENASTFARSLPSPILADFAISLLEQGKKEEALKLANEIQDLRIKKSTLELIQESLEQIQGPSILDCIIM